MAQVETGESDAIGQPSTLMQTLVSESIAIINWLSLPRLGASECVSEEDENVSLSLSSSLWAPFLSVSRFHWPMWVIDTVSPAPLAVRLRCACNSLNVFNFSRAGEEEEREKAREEERKKERKKGRCLCKVHSCCEANKWLFLPACGCRVVCAWHNEKSTFNCSRWVAKYFHSKLLEQAVNFTIYHSHTLQCLLTML